LHEATRVKDGRRGYAAWLRKTGVGFCSKGAAQEVPAAPESQSIERAKPFAQVYASVLRANDVARSVRTYLS